MIVKAATFMPGRVIIRNPLLVCGWRTARAAFSGSALRFELHTVPACVLATHRCCRGMHTRKPAVPSLPLCLSWS